MIDLHSHILPGIDDGARDRAVALDMARMFVADGITTLACTPHILPGLYHNSGPSIREHVARLQLDLDEAGIDLRLVTGADNHVVPDFVRGLQTGHLLSLGDTRYVLVEPPHHIVPPRIDDLFFGILVAGYVPVLTHPERLTWIKGNYEVVQRLAGAGVWMQITAGSLTGDFGSQPQYWAQKMIDDGLVHILATDAHNTDRRPPNLSRAFEAASRQIGAAEARHLVVTRPQLMLANCDPSTCPVPTSAHGRAQSNAADHRETTASRSKPADQHSDVGGGSIAGRLRRFLGQ
jgi:protein-tyrosine phosphatase